MAGSIRQRGPSWVADISIGNKRKTKSFPSRAEAAQWLNQQQARPGDGSQPFSLAQAKLLSSRVRWTDRGTGEPRAYHRTAMIYCDSAIEYFGEACLVTEVTAPKVLAWMERLLEGGNAAATVNRKLSALKAMMRDAASHGHLEAMPHLPQQLSCRNTRNRTIADHERRALVEALHQMGEPAAADFFELLLETAARFGEANRLKGGDVDLNRRTVTFWKTKAGRPRTVPLTHRAVECLRPHLPTNPAHRLWPFEYPRFKLLFDRAKQACPGLADDNSLTIHCARHTCASKLASRGIPLHQIMAFGGWTSLASVQRYMHLQTAALQPCVAVLEEG